MNDDLPNRLISRPLLMAWCVWLLVSWAIHLSLAAPYWINDPELHVAGRGMIESIMIGLGLIWPAWRLSMPGRESPGAQTAADLISLLAVAQLVIWPLRPLVDWSMATAGLVDGVLAVWGAAAGLCVWGGLVGRSPASRSVATGLCAVLLFGTWLWVAATQQVSIASWNPLYMLWTLSRNKLEQEDLRWIALQLTVLAAVVLIVWTAMRIRFRPAAAEPV